MTKIHSKNLTERLKLEWWWSASDRLWIVQIIDRETDFQVGDADYAANKYHLGDMLAHMEAVAREIEKKGA